MPEVNAFELSAIFFIVVISKQQYTMKRKWLVVYTH